MNKLLASDYRGHIPPGRLFDRVHGAEPIRGDDGRVWTHREFIDLHMNYIELPTAYRTLEYPEMDAREAEELNAKVLDTFRSYLKRCGVRPSAGMEWVLESMGDLSYQEAALVEDALLGAQPLTPDQQDLLRRLHDAVSKAECSRPVPASEGRRHHAA
ncbi:MAG: hypothetical protein AAFX65_00010 [Cyanobacteria bacterium J06638_7]